MSNKTRRWWEEWHPQIGLWRRNEKDEGKNKIKKIMNNKYIILLFVKGL